METKGMEEDQGLGTTCDEFKIGFTLDEQTKKNLRLLKEPEYDKSNPKLGAAYNVFDGIELLEGSIRSVRPVVSYVVVVFQTVSNFGVPAPKGTAAALRALKEMGVVDELIGV